MHFVLTTLSHKCNRVFASEKTGGILLISCTIVSLLFANSTLSETYFHLWHVQLAGLSVEPWINDALMAIFFLLVGLELQREIQNGELSNLRSALLPMMAAVGGIAVPALIHYALDAGTPGQAGMGIPMATDIAFALAVLMLLGALFVFASLFCMNRGLQVRALAPYLIGGALMWFLMFKSGVHATIAGVLLAFAMPYSAKNVDAQSLAHRLEQLLHKPVAFVILPIFALASTGILISADSMNELLSHNSLGILAGLVLGKPLGISLACMLAVGAGLCTLPPDLRWRHVVGVGMLGGIGFTMSIFITSPAFGNDPSMTNASKMAILMASLAAGVAGLVWLSLFGKPVTPQRQTGFNAPCPTAYCGTNRFIHKKVT